MRQKKLSYVTEALLKSKGVIIEPTKIKLDPTKITHLEVGSGKGQFITSLARDHRDQLFIAFEMNMSVLYRIVEKKEMIGLDNLIIILGDAKNLEQYFDKDQIDYIYLNFSDPWPKKKHHKRRLTYQTFLTLYKDILKQDGIFQFRTDVYPFFVDSIDYVETYFNIFESDTDLAPSLYMTEYEEKKRVHTKINQLKGRLKHD
jgi:tRNA (guanine-N7-)-methyltransferase